MDINLAYYHKKDWKRFLEIAEDESKANLHDTWQQWHKDYLKLKNKLVSEGFVVNDLIVDLDELQKFCFLNGLINDSNARSQFASQSGLRIA